MHLEVGGKQLWGLALKLWPPQSCEVIVAYMCDVRASQDQVGHKSTVGDEFCTGLAHLKRA